MGVPKGSPSCDNFFHWGFLPKDFKHVDLVPRMGDVQIVFGILFIDIWCNTHQTYFDASLLALNSWIFCDSFASWQKS